MGKFRNGVASLVWIAAVFVAPRPAPGTDSFGIRTSSTCMEPAGGTLVYRNTEGTDCVVAPLLDMEVELRITGLIARAKVSQRFLNPSDLWLEGVYLFPLPEMAAVDRLQMQIGERVVEGRIQEREQARRTYEKAKGEGKKASLVTQQRPNVFRTTVANIGPGEEIAITIEYQETLHYDQGEFQLRFPLVVAPRYGPPETHEDPDAVQASWTGTPGNLRAETVDAAGGFFEGLAGGVSFGTAMNSPSQSPTNPVQLSVELDPGFPLERLFSPSHPIEVVPIDDTAYFVGFQGENQPADRDFVLRWSPRAEADPQAALFSEEIDGELYSLLLVLPPDENAPGRQIGRELVFVIDTSGSMGGASIRQARQALALALERLHPDDRFNVVEFNSTARKLFPESVWADPARVAEARRYVEGLEANGGTEMLSALQAALESDSGGGEVRQVVFITDGSVSNEQQLFEYIVEHLGSSRLFTVGIGSAPNGYFMKRAARFGRGSFTMIGTPLEVAERMEALFSKLESPELTDIAVHWNDSVEAWPARVPDLYQGEPVVVAARIPRFVGEVIVSGRAGSQFWEVRLPLGPGVIESGIEKLWARRKIASLMDELSAGADRAQVREAVVAVALQHELVSRYTSLVAVDVTPTRPKSATGGSASVLAKLPHGWSPPGVLPSTATPSRLYLTLGAAFLLLAWALRRRGSEAS